MDQEIVYEKLPADIAERYVLVMDPILGTGGSAARAVKVGGIAEGGGRCASPVLADHGCPPLAPHPLSEPGLAAARRPPPTQPPNPPPTPPHPPPLSLPRQVLLDKGVDEVKILFLRCGVPAAQGGAAAVQAQHTSGRPGWLPERCRPRPALPTRHQH